MEFEAVPIVAVAIILYAFSEILKGTILKNKDEWKAVLPYCCAILGAVIGAVIYLIDPTILGCESILDAVVSGAVSGLVATGANQIYKQFAKLLAVTKAEKEDIDEEVANMDSDERKEYLLNTVTETANSVLDKIKEKQETSTDD